MRSMLLILVVWLAVDVVADAPDPPLAEKRLPVSTLVREDVFAGWRANDMQRYARAEKNIEQLLQDRPRERAELLAWKGGTKVYRAVLALESGNAEECERDYQQALALFAEAKKLAPAHPTVAAVAGGTYVLFADRIPEPYRAAAWAESYDDYQTLWRLQGKAVKQLPLHIRGELLAGIAQTSQRTGRAEQLAETLEQITELLPDTGYARVAQQWKDDPAMLEWRGFMGKYYKEGDPKDASNLYAYITAQVMVQILKQCGNDLTRENVMRQAANLKNFKSNLLLPGMSINTSPTDFYPIEQAQLAKFTGTLWQGFGDLITVSQP